MKTLSSNTAFGGIQGVFSHASDVCACQMTFAVYLPPQAKKGPVLWYLFGPTSTQENAVAKAIAQKTHPATFRMQAGHDRSYFFVATFMKDHITHHADILHGL